MSNPSFVRRCDFLKKVLGFKLVNKVPLSARKLKKIVGTKNAREGVKQGMHVLRDGGTAIDAVEKAVRVTEENADDWSVGYGGFPNLLGTVELDASIMEGKTLNAGAVAAIHNFMHPISIARKVMEELPHVLLVGEGAERFAEQYQFEKTKLLTEEIKRQYREFEKGGVPLLTRKERIDDLNEEEKEEKQEWMRKYLEDHRIREFYERFKLKAHGTVNVIALDKEGNMCVGVSTSGTPLKIPGRVGDTPLIGAGIGEQINSLTFLFSHHLLRWGLEWDIGFSNANLARRNLKKQVDWISLSTSLDETRTLIETP